VTRQPAISFSISFQPLFQSRRWAHIKRSANQMKTLAHSIIAAIFGISPLIANAEESDGKNRPEQAVEMLRNELSQSKSEALAPPWDKMDEWKMTDYYPPQEAVNNAYALLKKTGHKDLITEGAIYYSVGDGKHVLLITSDSSQPNMGKYYCLGFDSKSKTPNVPLKAWVTYKEVIHKFTHVPITIAPKAEQGAAGQPATSPESKPENNQKPQPKSEGRSR
jgi:hypothetical protein